MAEKVEYFKGYLFWGVAKKIIRYLAGLTLLGLSGLMLGLVFMIGLTLLMFYALSTLPYDDRPSWGKSEWAEDCWALGREWNDDTLSCDMTPVSAIFTDHVNKHGRSSMSEHLAYNKFMEIAKESGETVKLRGCLYLLQTELVKQGVKVESVYDEDTVDSCSRFIGQGS